MTRYQKAKRHDMVRAVNNLGFISRGGAKHEVFVHPELPDTKIALPRDTEIGVKMTHRLNKQINQLAQRLKAPR